eukprot:5397009-Amphidinium_carterae.1
MTWAVSDCARVRGFPDSVGGASWLDVTNELISPVLGHVAIPIACGKCILDVEFDCHDMT